MAAVTNNRTYSLSNIHLEDVADDQGIVFLFDQLQQCNLPGAGFVMQNHPHPHLWDSSTSVPDPVYSSIEVYTKITSVQFNVITLTMVWDFLDGGMFVYLSEVAGRFPLLFFKPGRL